MTLLNLPEAWNNTEGYLAHRKLKLEASSETGLTFIGYMGARSAYQLPFDIKLTKQVIAALYALADEYDGLLELAMYPRIKVNGRHEPLLEVVDWQGLHFVLVPINYGPKSILFQKVLNVLNNETPKS